MEHPLIVLLKRISRILWRGMTLPHADLVLLALVMVAALLGGLLPQARADPAVDASLYQTGFSAPRDAGSGGAQASETLGLTRLYTSRVWRVLWVLVAMVAVLRLLQGVVPGWATSPAHPISRAVALPGDEAGAWGRVTSALSQSGLCLVQRVTLGAVTWAVARRPGIRRWLPTAFYLGLLVLMVTGIVARRYGWQGPYLDLAVGETRSLESTPNLAVRLDELALLPRADGALQRLDSTLALLKGNAVQGQVTTRSGQPARYAGLTLYQLGYGPAARVNAQDASGEPLTVQRMVGDTTPRRVQRVRFSARQQERLMAVPHANLIVRLVYYPALQVEGAPQRTLHVQLQRGSDGQLLAERFLPTGGTLEVGDYTVEVALEPYVTLRAEREPELPLAAVGAMLLLVGLAGRLVWPSREVWIAVRAEAQGCTCQLYAAPGEADAPWFQSVLAALREAHDA